MSAVINRDPLRVALIGYGHGGAVFHAPLIAATAGLELAAIVTGSPDRSTRARHAFPDTSILASAELVWDNAADYDLIVISTPNRSHVSLAVTALEAGLAVVVDKPLATSVVEAERLVAASRRLERLLTVFHNARWASTFLTTREVIASGLLGRITRYEARMDRYRPQPRRGAWRELPEPNEGGGLLLDLGTHLIDQAVQLFGWPRRVYAEVEHRRPGSQVDDDTFVALEFDELRAHLWMSYVARLPGPAVRLHGLNGSFEKFAADPQEQALSGGQRPGEPTWGQEAPEQWGRLSANVAGLHLDGRVESQPGAYQLFYASLRDALHSGGAPPVDPTDAIGVLRVIEAARASARTATLREVE
jgi:scyllo-inositol 2-dehydrogenase (NADP+)